MAGPDARVALVTGAARGIGRATSEGFVRRGYRVVVADLDGEGAAQTAKDLGGDGVALAVTCDVTDRASADAAVAEVARTWGRLDALVNNAGTADPKPTHEVSEEAWEAVLRVHLGGTFRMTQAALPLLVQAEAASIVNVSSIAAHRPLPGRLSYNAAKGAIEAFTRTLAVEWGALGLRVNAVAPGFTLTELARTFYESGLMDADERARHTALGRLAEPYEIANVICFLASDEASYLTGQVIAVDGGYLVDGRTGPDQLARTAEEIRAGVAGRIAGE